MNQVKSQVFLDTVEADIMEECRKLGELLIAKRRDYGAENILKHGTAGIVIRMDDKIARINNLHKQVLPNFESVSDTWNDIAGYAVIGKLIMEGKYA